MTEQQEKTQDKPAYKMPHVELGQIVCFYPDAVRSSDSEETMFCGIVTGLGNDSVNLNVFSPTSYNMMIRDGVRHVEDPKANHPSLRTQGGWEHTRETKRLQKLQVQVQMLYDAVAKRKAADGG